VVFGSDKCLAIKTETSEKMVQKRWVREKEFIKDQRSAERLNVRISSSNRKNKRVNLSYVGSINLTDTKNKTGQVPPLGADSPAVKVKKWEMPEGSFRWLTRSHLKTGVHMQYEYLSLVPRPQCRIECKLVSAALITFTSQQLLHR